jgi:hypothetical protein
MKYMYFLFATCFLQIAGAEQSDLKVLNIDGIGPDQLSTIKQSSEVNWWVEMGDKMIVATNHSSNKIWPVGVVVESTLTDVNTEHLAFHVLGHCDHSETDEILHHKLNVVYSSLTTRIINTTDITDKSQLLKHDSILPFEQNKVLTYQLKNRKFDNLQQKNNQIQILVDQVDQQRWYAQVEFLAGLDRYEEADLNTAGEWLEGKFSKLGLVTSRVTLNSFYRGFNVLGFKQGTSRADDWYVVGAHLDSRNRTRDESLPSPGAEDNASGCSGVLEIANIISAYETEASIVFMCFIEEEQGLLGSKDVVTHFTNEGDIDKVKTMLNMDMISYRNGDRNTAIAGTNTNQYQSLVNTIAANGNQYTDIDWQVNLNMCCTDFVSFVNAGIPAATSNQPDISSYFGYHSTQDLAVNLDPTLGAGIVKANLVTLIDLVGVDFSTGDVIFANGFEKF